MKSRKLENVNNLHMASNRAQYPWWPQHLVSNTCSPVISFKVPVRMFFASYLSTCIILHSQCTFNTMIRTYVFIPTFSTTFQSHISTPSAIRPELASRRAEHSLPYSNVTIIFSIYNIYHLCCMCIDFYDLSTWGGCWFVVYIRRFIYNFLNVCLFYYTAVAVNGKVGPVNRLTTPVGWP